MIEGWQGNGRESHFYHEAGIWQRHFKETTRLRGRPQRAASAHPLQEGPVRQPARTAPEKPAGAADRGAQRAGHGDDRRRARKITKREAVVTQLVNKSAAADLRTTKMLDDMAKDAERNAGAAPPLSAL
jgi:hypothetical protein